MFLAYKARGGGGRGGRGREKKVRVKTSVLPFLPLPVSLPSKKRSKAERNCDLNLEISN